MRALPPNKRRTGGNSGAGSGGSGGGGDSYASVSRGQPAGFTTGESQRHGSIIIGATHAGEAPQDNRAVEMSTTKAPGRKAKRSSNGSA